MIGRILAWLGIWEPHYRGRRRRGAAPAPIRDERTQQIDSYQINPLFLEQLKGGWDGT